MMVLILATQRTKEQEVKFRRWGECRKLTGALLPVRDGEDGLVPKPLPDGLLQQFVRLLVHAGGGLVDAQELRVEKQRLQGRRRSHPDATQI